ncbi:MAG: hypothetical protein ACYCZL_10565, partial [Polaromonas sp.]
GARLVTAELSAVRTESISGSSICAPALACSENNSEVHPADKDRRHFLLEIFPGRIDMGIPGSVNVIGN